MRDYELLFVLDPSLVLAARPVKLMFGATEDLLTTSTRRTQDTM